MSLRSRLSFKEKYKYPFNTRTGTHREKYAHFSLFLCVHCSSVDPSQSRVVGPFLPAQTDVWEGTFPPSFPLLPVRKTIFFGTKSSGRELQKSKAYWFSPFCGPQLIDWRAVFSLLSQNILLMLKKRRTVRKPSPILQGRKMPRDQWGLV